MKKLSSVPNFLVAVLLTSLVFFSCSENESPSPQNTEPVITDKGTPSGEVASKSIGTSGGTLQSADGKLTITIPSGALSSNTTISIQPITNEAPLGLGLGYSLQPEGLTFTKPVELKFHYDGQLLKNTLEDFLWIVTQASDGSWNALLKSVVDTGAKTVTVNTAHFSDWALGRFIDLSLNPSSSTLSKGQSVKLLVAGFVRDNAIQEDDELAPLVPITGDGDQLTPLTVIPPVESRLMTFRIKRWTLNGSGAPVSNSNGTLSASGNSATYTAPNQKPSVNPVAVSVELEASNKEGAKSSFMLTASISIVDSDLYLLLKVDGQTYEYYQYGFNGTIPPDPNNIAMVNCGFSDGKLGIGASHVKNSNDLRNNFGFELSSPAESSKTLTCFYKDGDDDINFAPLPGTAFEMDYIKRTPKPNDYCDTQYECGHITVTLLTFTGGHNSKVRGYFSGTLYEDKPGYWDLCKTPDTHSIEGEFNLVLAN